MEERNLIRINDMGLVAYLRYCDEVVLEVKWADGKCYWLFQGTMEAHDLMRQWNSELARVEPRRYNRCYNNTKTEFYESGLAVGQIKPRRR